MALENTGDSLKEGLKKIADEYAEIGSDHISPNSYQESWQHQFFPSLGDGHSGCRDWPSQGRVDGEAQIFEVQLENPTQSESRDKTRDSYDDTENKKKGGSEYEPFQVSRHADEKEKEIDEVCPKLFSSVDVLQALVKGCGGNDTDCGHQEEGVAQYVFE